MSTHDLATPGRSHRMEQFPAWAGGNRQMHHAERFYSVGVVDARYVPSRLNWVQNRVGREKMNEERFQLMVARLERESARSQAAYQFKVAMLALLGFGVLLLVMGLAGLGIFLVVGLLLLVMVKGGAAVLLLAKFGKALVLLAVPLWYLIKSSFRALLVRLPAPQGVELTRQQAPELFAAMDDMRRRMRGPRFHHVLLVDDVNAAVVQRPLLGLFGLPRNYLLLGLPLLESMSPEEALAVVAHEYGHLAGSHGRFGAFIYRLRLTWATIAAYADQWEGWVGKVLRRLVQWYAPYFNAYTFVLARAQEYQADRASAELVGPAVVSHALKRVNLAGPHYQQFIGQTFDRIAQLPAPPQDLAMGWAAAADTVTEADGRRWLDEALDRPPQALDTHPTLRARLAALALSGDDMAAMPPARVGESAAVRWLGSLLPAMRARFQGEWAERVAEPWAQRHREIQANRARLAQLRQMAETDPLGWDDQYELLRLRVQLEPDVDSLTSVVDLNAAHPDRPAALYLEACLRLDRGDEVGLALLERVMALDAESTKPCCERAHAYLSAHGDEARAQTYAQRWQARHAFEEERAAQLNRLDPTHPLEAPQLDSETAAQLRALLQKLDRKGVRRLYLARRVIPADPTAQTYVLGVTLTWWAQRRGQQSAILQRLAEQPWPLPLFVCSLTGSNKPIAKSLKRLQNVEV